MDYKEYGFNTGIGLPFSAYSVPEGSYKPIYFMLHMGAPIYHNFADINKRQIITLYSEPQINYVHFELKSGEVLHEWEFGINSGLKFIIPINNILNIYLLGGAGPHYFTATIQKQVQGFIFSDCIGHGVYINTSSHSAIHMEFRIRHMSNLDIQKPNNGINNVNFHVGWSKFFY
ncbi:MAG: acyloxyacyl hydrolase [Cytophagales bacterium]|nr:acyloxyacyl hydrolase [Cytophagales bacterium]